MSRFLSLLILASLFSPSVLLSQTEDHPLSLAPEAQGRFQQAMALAREAGAPGLFWKGSFDEVVRRALESASSPAQLLRQEEWRRRLGLRASAFLATYYIANPFTLLPADIREAIQALPEPFEDRKDVWVWLKQAGDPPGWRKALRNALRETTPINLWRASRGLPPFTKSGKYLKPLMVHQEPRRIHLRAEGDIATDPSWLETGTEVLLLIDHNGKTQVVKAKAADTGGGVKGKHLDIPIYVKPSARPVYFTNNSPALKRTTVTVLHPMTFSEYARSHIREWSSPARWLLFFFLGS